MVDTVAGKLREFLRGPREKAKVPRARTRLATGVPPVIHTHGIFRRVTMVTLICCNGTSFLTLWIIVGSWAISGGLPICCEKAPGTQKREDKPFQFLKVSIEGDVRRHFQNQNPCGFLLRPSPNGSCLWHWVSQLIQHVWIQECANADGRKLRIIETSFSQTIFHCQVQRLDGKMIARWRMGQLQVAKLEVFFFRYQLSPGNQMWKNPEPNGAL